MTENIFKKTEEILTKAAEKVLVPSTVDKLILSERQTIRESSINTSLMFTVSGAVCMLAIAVIIFFPPLLSRIECSLTLKKMAKAVETHNVEEILSFVSSEEYSKVERNIINFYQKYDRISYKIKDLKIRSTINEAVAETSYELVAENKKESIKYSGKDRIWMARDNGKFKILYWIDG